MSLVVLGLSHHGAPLSLLESVALDPEARTELETAVLRSEHVTEAVVLSTCNRTEVYAECLTFHGALADITTALAEACSVDRNDLQPHLFVHYEERGIAHVFSVAAGLDSMAVGEAQILGQVRRSLARAQRHGHVGPALNTVLQQALRVAKRVHTETSIDLVSGSLVQAGLTRAEAELGGLGDLSVLVVGAGGMGALAATTAARAGARTVVIANRNHDRARSVAERVGGTALPLSRLAEALAAADVVISRPVRPRASSSPTTCRPPWPRGTDAPRSTSTWHCRTTSTSRSPTSPAPPGSASASSATTSPTPAPPPRSPRRPTWSPPRSPPTCWPARPRPWPPRSPRCAPTPVSWSRRSCAASRLAVVAVTAFLVNVQLGVGVLTALATAAGNTLAPLAAALLLQRLGFRRQLDRLRDALAIVGAAVSCTLISATIGSGALALSDAIPREDLPTAWAVWWTGDTMGILAVTPFLLSLLLFRELAALAAAAVGRARRHPRDRGPHDDVGGPVAAGALPRPARCRLGRLAPAAARRRAGGPHRLAHRDVDRCRPNRSLPGQALAGQMLTLHAFNACVALTSFVLAALVSERNKAAGALAGSGCRARGQGRGTHGAAVRAQRTPRGRDPRPVRGATAAEPGGGAHATRAQHRRDPPAHACCPSASPSCPGSSSPRATSPPRADLQVGGDWYDVIPLPDGRVGLAIGDVAGHGPAAAASTMAQVRMALRAYALQDPSPASVLRSVHRLVSQLPMPEMVTLLYPVHDPATGTLRYTNAGHPPVLAFDRTRASYLGGGLAPPIGVTAEAFFREATHELAPGTTLLLYTDGLVERRGDSITNGLDRLSEAAKAMAGADLERLCDHLLRSMIVLGDVADDVALIAVRPLPIASGPLRVTVKAEAPMLCRSARVPAPMVARRRRRGRRGERPPPGVWRSLRERRPACLCRGSGQPRARGQPRSGPPPDVGA